MSQDLTIEKIIARISAGDIRIPPFQRDFVWDADQVAFLLDSIYKEFPIGTVVLWKTDMRLQAEKNIGLFVLPEPTKDYPVNYVLDGQQRLTSLFSVFQTTLKPETDEWVDIYFDLEAKTEVQDPCFRALDPSEADVDRHFPVKTFFDSAAYRKATINLPITKAEKIDSVLRKFLSYTIPNIVFETEDLNNVAIVFERINRFGKPLNTFELLSAWSWSDSFDLVERFEELQFEIADHGFEELANDRDLLLRITAGIIKQSTTPATILQMNGNEIRDNFERVKNGIIGALDYLKLNLNIVHYKMLAFPGVLVPLSAFFATVKSDGFNPSDKQNQILKKWFWRALFTRRYSANVNEHQALDIVQMLALKKSDNHDFKFAPADIKFDFAKNGFSSANANSKTLITMLNQLRPNSLTSGVVIDLSLVLKKGSKHEYHHIFPKKYLEKLGVPYNQINCLANICFLTRSDNIGIKDKSPETYNKLISSVNREKYLEKALIPTDFNVISFKDFIDRRVKLLTSLAEELMR